MTETMSDPPASQPLVQVAATGLSSEEARQRLEQFGPNDPAPRAHHSIFQKILKLFSNPLTLILIVAAVVAEFLGQRVDAAIIFVVVFLGAFIDFFQTYRSEQAVKRLRERVAPTATVLRDGKWGELPRREIVPGDAVRLSSGDLVPADARLVAARDLFVQQAALTGESLPVEKEPGPDNPALYKNPSAPMMLFLGTSIVSGTGTAVVIATGPNTTFGDIAAKLAERPAETEFERGTAAIRLADPARYFFHGAVHSGDEPRAASQRVRIAAVCGGARRRPHAGIFAHDHQRDPGEWRGADVKAQGDREASSGDSKFWQHRCFLLG